MTYDDLDFFESDLRALCKRYSFKCNTPPDELFSDVCVDKWPQVVNAWDPKKGNFEGHLIRSMKWYLYKYVSRRREREGDQPIDTLPSMSTTTTVADHIDVADILARLSQEEADVLRWHVMMGYTFIEIAEHLGCTTASVSCLYKRAIIRARGQAKEEET